MALAHVQLRDLTGRLCKTAPGHHAFDHGNYADIWLGEFKDTHRKVAIKVIRSIFNEEDVRQLNDKLLREARLWSTLNHVNIAPFLGITTDMAEHSAPSLIAPFYKNGNLKSYVRDHELKIGNKMDLLYQFANGLAFLHSRGVIHGDIKPGNILVNDEHQAVLTDFGLSRVLEVTGFTTRSTPGTIRYMSPELLNPPASVTGPVRTSKTADIWAFAVAATQIFSLKEPYHHCRTEPSIFVYIVKGGTLKEDEYKNDIPGGVWTMLKQCWNADCSKRPSMEDITRTPRAMNPFVSVFVSVKLLVLFLGHRHSCSKRRSPIVIREMTLKHDTFLPLNLEAGTSKSTANSSTKKT